MGGGFFVVFVRPGGWWATENVRDATLNNYSQHIQHIQTNEEKRNGKYEV